MELHQLVVGGSTVLDKCACYVFFIVKILFWTGKINLSCTWDKCCHLVLGFRVMEPD